MFFLFGFVAWLVAYLTCLNILSETLFQIDFWTLVSRWWAYDEHRYLCLFINFLTLSSAICCGSAFQNLGILLLGKTRSYILLGKGHDGNLHVADELKPREGLVIKSHFSSEGAANIDSLYRRIILVAYGGQYFGPLEFRLAKQIILFGVAIALLFFPTVCNLLIFKVYAHYNELYRDFVFGTDTDIEGLFLLIKDQSDFLFYPWVGGLTGAIILFLFLFKVIRPKKIFNNDRLINLSPKIRDGYEMTATVVSKEDHYARQRSNTSRKPELLSTYYLLRLGEPFRPDVHLMWICDAAQKERRRKMEKIVSEQGQVRVRVIGPDPGETAFGVDVIDG